MSIKITGPRVISTAGNTILSGATKASMSIRFRFDPTGTSTDPGNYIFGRSDGTGFSIFSDRDGFSHQALNISMFSSLGTRHGFLFSTVFGTDYHIVATWDSTTGSQVFYLDGRVMATASDTNPMQSVSGSTKIQLGMNAVYPTCTYFLDDCWLWSGAILTPGDIAAIRDRTVTPNSLYPSSLAWGTSLEGTDGSTVTSGDSGLIDAVAGLNLTPSGSGSAVWSSYQLTFAPGLLTSARINKSGKTISIYFTKASDGTDAYPDVITSNPTISINGGSPINLTTPVPSTPNSGPPFQVPFFMYGLPSKLLSSDVLTYSCPVGWAEQSGQKFTAFPPIMSAGSTNAVVSNGAGQMNFTKPDPTMDLGLNISDSDYYFIPKPWRNMMIGSNFWRGNLDRDANGKPINMWAPTMYCKLPDGTDTNGLDALSGGSPTSIPWMTDNPNFYTVVISESSPSNNSGGYIVAGAEGNAIVTERTDLAVTPADGIKKQRVFEVTRRASPTTYNLDLHVTFTRDDFTEAYVFGPGNTIDYNDIADEYTKQAVAGSKVTRFMDMARINNCSTAIRSHLKPLTDFNNHVGRPALATIAAVNPVASDQLYKYAYSAGWMVAEITTTAPHPFYTGQYLLFGDILQVTDCLNLTPLPGGTLAANVGVSDTSITLVDASQIVYGDYLSLDSELMQCLSPSPSTPNVMPVIRASRGTTAAVHSTGTSGPSYTNAIFCSDGITRATTHKTYTTIVVTSPTTFVVMLYHGNNVLNPTTGTAWATTQNFDSSSYIGYDGSDFGTAYEYMFKLSASLGTDPWICVPFPATDDCVQAIAEKARDNLAVGSKVWVEFSNEIWNPGFSQYIACKFKGNLESPPISAVNYGSKRAGEVHNIFASVFGAAGRSGDFVRVISYQWGNSDGARAVLDFCVANSIAVDAYAIAPYIDFPSDPSVAAAVDSYDADQLHDFWQLFLTRGYPVNSSLPGAYLPTHKAALNATFPNAKLVCYEGSLQTMMGVATNRVPRIHDLVYHPQYHDTMTAFLTSLQNGGVELFIYYMLSHHVGWAQTTGGWDLVYRHGQPWGYGDGSDGKANNLDCLAVSKPADVQQDYQNVSVGLQAWKDWAQVTPPPVISVVGSIITQGYALTWDQLILQGYSWTPPVISIVGSIITQGYELTWDQLILQGYSWTQLPPTIPVIGSLVTQGYALLSGTINLQGYSHGPPSLYPFETMPRFYQSIINVIQQSELFGPRSVFYVVNPDDAEIKWPQTPPPFVLVVPGQFFDSGVAVGAGRFGKNWEVFWEIRLVVRNVLDDSWHDTDAVTTLSRISGSYPNVDALLNVMEQSYPLDINNQLSMTELPYCIGVGELTRFKKSQEYLYIPMYFRCEFCSYLTAVLP